MLETGIRFQQEFLSVNLNKDSPLRTRILPPLGPRQNHAKTPKSLRLQGTLIVQYSEEAPCLPPQLLAFVALEDY